MNGSERGVARFLEIRALGVGQIFRQRCGAVFKQRINTARRLNGELRIEFHRPRQISLALFDHRRHRLQTRGG